MALSANAFARARRHAAPAYSALTRCGLMLSKVIGHASVFVSFVVATIAAEKYR